MTLMPTGGPRGLIVEVSPGKPGRLNSLRGTIKASASYGTGQELSHSTVYADRAPAMICCVRISFRAGQSQNLKAIRPLRLDALGVLFRVQSSLQESSELIPRVAEEKSRAPPCKARVVVSEIYGPSSHGVETLG